MLSPSIIAKLYTLEEIETQITILQQAYIDAIQNEKYTFDDIQAKQSVTNQSLEKLSNELNSWLKAKSLSSGEANTSLYSGNYTGKHD